MSSDIQYPYASGNLLEKPNTYFYTPYQGESFISAWKNNRAECLATCSLAVSTDYGVDENRLKATGSPTASYFQSLKMLFTQPDFPVSDRKNLDAIMRNFEAKKRLYKDYNPGFTSKDRSDYHELGLYVLFAEVMVAAYTKWQELPYLNALIKCMDILCAYRTGLTNPEKLKMCDLIDAEANYVGQLARRLGGANNE